MDEKRRQEYLELIKKLLSCSTDEEINQILVENKNLLDIGFLQTIVTEADKASNEGDESTANRLRYLANARDKALKSSPSVPKASPTIDIKQSLESLKEAKFQPYGQFLAEVLQATDESKVDPQVVYPKLKANINKLDDNLAEILRRWATSIFEEVEEKKAESIGIVIINFSTLIRQFPLGNKANNMEIAITGYEVILTIFTKDASPEIWAAIQYNLGNAYYQRIKGGKADNIELAISSYQDALTVYTRNDFPQNWAMTLSILGVAYSDRIKGDKADNIELAISSYQDALTVYTRNDFPQNWAMTLSILGNVYMKRIKGDKADNIELAISSYQDALTVYTRNDFPQEWAATQYNLGIAYSDRMKGDKADNIELAINSYKEVLNVHTRNDFPQDRAATQNNLGNAYCDRIKGDKADNIELAINSYKEALTVRTRNDFPQGWATTQNGLGTAYSDRMKGDKADNIELAINSYKEALTVRTRNDFPQDWAITQMNLGTAYCNRIRGDKADNIELAINSYKEALDVYTRNDFPKKWADTQINLGIAYFQRIKGDKADNIELAINSYKEALDVYTRNDFPQDWAMTQMNLGNAYSKRIKGDKADNIELAINSYKEALGVYTRNDFPQDWANTQNNLGGAYSDRIKGDKADNIELAINSYKDALDVYTRNDFPQNWAATQNNLGAAYRNRIKGAKADNIEHAILCYKDALTVRTRKDFPQDNALTLENLGIAYQDAKRFNEAYTTFEQAIETVESLRGEIVSGDETKRKQSEEWNALYRRMVEVCLELKEDTQAIEYAERSKTRNLVELILERDSKTIFPPEVVTQLEQLRDEIATGQYKIQNGKAENPQVLAQHLQQLRKQRNELQDRYLPVGSGFKFDSFQTTLDERTVIIEWYILDKILAFIIKPTGEITVWQSQPENMEAFKDWVLQYLINYYSQKDKWQNSLEEELKKLASILHIDEILDQIPFDCDKLILIPHRLLHLLPLHALPVASQDSKNSLCLLDLFAGGVGYAPSCQLLQLTQTRKRSNFTDIFAIQNPTDSGTPLNYADLEVQIIKNNFKSAQILEKDKASKEALNQVSLNSFHCIHFSCHGYFNFYQPQKSALSLAESVINSTATDSENHFQLTEHSTLNLKNCLTLNDIFSVNLDNCRLVVLSACETGLIDSSNVSDEYIGLPSGFLFAGSPTVVSSLWKVDDLATTFLLIKFYSNLKNLPKIEQGDMAVALKEAQIWLRSLNTQQGEKFFIKEILPHIDQIFLEKSAKAVKTGALKRIKEKGSYPFADPIYWAAFIATGF